MLQTSLMAAGLSAQAVQAMAGPVVTGLVGAGSSNTDALPIGAGVNVFATVASGSGCILPAGAQIGDELLVCNITATNALLVYPPPSGQINSLTATTGGFSIATNKSARFIRTALNNWAALLSA